MSIIPATQEVGQKDGEFKASMGKKITTPVLKPKKKKKKKG
jgi:hypothetical protein